MLGVAIARNLADGSSRCYSIASITCERRLGRQRVLTVGDWRFHRPAHLDGLLRLDPVAEIRPIAMDLGSIEVTDERQDLAAEHLSRHQDGKPGG